MSTTLTTKYLPATDKKGSRIVVSWVNQRLYTMPYRHDLNGYDNHVAAMIDCVEKKLPELTAELDNVARGEVLGGYVFIVGARLHAY